MTSRRQRRVERAADERRAVAKVGAARPVDAVVVNRAQLAPSNSYGAPAFVTRGTYLDAPFRCVDCGADEVWTATQQKWWYEVAKGFAYSTARRCRACRRAVRERSAAAREVHQGGLARKAAGLPKPGRR